MLARLREFFCSNGMSPSRPFATVAVEGSFGIKSRQSFAYSGRSLTRMSSAGTPSTSASATRASAPYRTRAFDQLVWPGGR
jgi:hypothetical protein